MLGRSSWNALSIVNLVTLRSVIAASDDKSVFSPYVSVKTPEKTNFFELNFRYRLLNHKKAKSFKRGLQLLVFELATLNTRFQVKANLIRSDNKFTVLP